MKINYREFETGMGRAFEFTIQVEPGDRHLEFLEVGLYVGEQFGYTELSEESGCIAFDVGSSNVARNIMSDLRHAGYEVVS